MKLELMFSIILFAAYSFASTGSAANQFGNWRIASVKEVRKSPPANLVQAKAFIGKKLILKADSIEYGEKLFWFERPCEHVRYEFKSLRSAKNDPTRETDYGLRSAQHLEGELVISCQWLNEKLTPTFYFEVVSRDKMALYWDGCLILLEREK